jgi:DNA-binding transcriptional LysR family regulator
MLEDFRLTVFVAVAQSRSFTKAAAQLSISQPAVSQHISELEKTTGMKLFQRLRGETIMTDAGALFHQYAKDILAKYDEMEQMFLRFPDKVVKVAASDEIYNHLVSNLLDTFLRVHPEVVFQHSFMQEDADLRVTIAPSENEKGTIRLAYHPSVSFAATRLWIVLSKALQPTLE